jgi:4-amino-4-deoxy-L-arabinose transferase-like glycosyltransferase
MRVAFPATNRWHVARPMLLLPAGVVLVALLFLAHHIVATSPLTVTGALVPLAHLFDLLLLVGTLLLAHAAGARVLRAMGLALMAAEGAAFALALGLGLGAYGAFALGLIGLYRPPILLGCGVLAAVLLRRELQLSVGEFRALGAGVLRALRTGGMGVSAIVTILGLAAGLTLLTSLAPPHHWDPLAYHLTAPEIFLRSGWIRPIPDLDYSNVPLTTELLFGIGLAAGSLVYGQLLHCACVVIIGLGVWGLARRYRDPVTAWLALALFASTPLVLVWARVADNDLFFACFILLAVAAVLRAGAGGEDAAQASRWLVLAGVFAGLALGTKFQALYALLPLGAALALDVWYAEMRATGHFWRAGRTALRGAALFGAVTLLVAAPWYIKNALLFGNPFYPMLFGGRGLSPIAVDITAEVLHNRVLSPRTLVGYALLPLRAYTIGSYEQPHAILNPLFLLCPAILLLRGRWGRDVWYALVVSAGFIVAFTQGVQELRYLLTITPLLSLLVAYVLRAAWERALLRRLVAVALAGAALVTFAFIGLFVGGDSPFGVISGQESTETYLHENLAYGPSHRALTFLAAQLRPGERALFMHEAQIFYLSDQLVPGETVVPDHQNLQPMLLAETYHDDPGEMLLALQREGIDYVVVNEANIRSWLKSDPHGRLAAGKAALDRLTPQFEQIYLDGRPDRPNIIIYRVPHGTASR